MAYQKTFHPAYYQVKQKWLSIFTGKKVEIFHSLLRKGTRNWSTGPEIQNTARTIGSSGFLAYFKEWFVPTYQRGSSEANYWNVAGKTAEYFLELFKKIAANMDKACEVPRAMSKNGKPKGRQTFELPSFGANVDVRSFPLSYQNEQFGQVQPDEEALCDLPSCCSSSRGCVE